jgi:glutaconate CoA-transferase subunit A
MNDMPSKLISLSEAADLVSSGDLLALGGLTIYRRPVAFTMALLKRYLASQTPSHITLLAFTAGYESDLLVGCGLARSVRTCYFGLEIFGLAPMFTQLGSQGLIDIIEETEASLAFGLRAQMAGVGFMPGRGWLGTDLPRLRPDVRTVIDPYSGEELMAFPAIHPDIAVLHALVADPEGNCQIGKNQGVDIELAVTARTLIITSEEIVPALSQADIVAPFVEYVVHAPRGAAPTSCHPLYPVNGAALLDYIGQVNNPESFAKYLEKIL